MLCGVMTNTTTAQQSTLRERAISLREEWLRDELAKRRFVSDELATADEKRATSERVQARLRRELETLQAMPESVSGDDVLSAMGVAS